MMAHQHPEAPTVPASRLPDPALPIPAIAWPTVALFVVAGALLGATTTLALAGSLSYLIAIPLNAIALYLFFTVLHDASHRTVSQTDAVNRWLGRISAPFLTPFASYSVFRYIHMQHHRFTNDRTGQDPDAYTTHGPSWSWPLRWATIDFAYMRYYLPRLASRPRPDQIEFGVTLLITASAIVAFIVLAGASEFLLLIALPSRLNVMFLGFAFDWLPHNGLSHTPDSDRFKTTRNRVGLEWLMTPALLYQNYHLVHHMHPLIPFYRYLTAWRRNEDAYLANDAPLRTVGGRDLSAEEYRARRASSEPAGR